MCSYSLMRELIALGAELISVVLIIIVAVNAGKRLKQSRSKADKVALGLSASAAVLGGGAYIYRLMESRARGDLAKALGLSNIF